VDGCVKLEEEMMDELLSPNWVKGREPLSLALAAWRSLKSSNFVGGSGGLASNSETGEFGFLDFLEETPLGWTSVGDTSGAVETPLLVGVGPTLCVESIGEKMETKDCKWLRFVETIVVMYSWTENKQK
jgi:hypothetical protein